MSPKFVVRVNPETLKYDTFRYDDPGPVPPIVEPENPEEAKDGGVARSGEEHAKKQEASKRPS